MCHRQVMGEKWLYNRITRKLFPYKNISNDYLHIKYLAVLLHLTCETIPKGKLKETAHIKHDNRFCYLLFFFFFSSPKFWLIQWFNGHTKLYKTISKIERNFFDQFFGCCIFHRTWHDTHKKYIWFELFRWNSCHAPICVGFSPLFGYKRIHWHMRRSELLWKGRKRWTCINTVDF